MSTSLDDDLGFAAARHALGVLSAEDIIALARRAIDLGRLPGAVCELATVREEYPTIGELGPLFEEWLSGEGVRVPGRETAIWQVLGGWITRISRGEIAPYHGLCHIMDEVYYGENLYDKTSNYVGDSHGIEQLVGDFYDHDDLVSQPIDGAVVEFDRIVVKHADDWLRRYPP